MRVRPPRIAGYVLGPRLGGGPTCEVFSATESATGAVWAIKVLREEALDDETNLLLFRREARVGLTVRHPSLVRFLRAETYLRTPYHVVMERLPGQSLRAVLLRAGSLDFDFVVRLLRQIAEALAALQQYGIVHGDVKPDNIHLPEPNRAKLLDFGFAHRPGEDRDLFGDGFVLGTANYVAPELCQIPPDDNPAADIFSLGVTCYELLTGELPYPLGSVEQTMVQHRDREACSLHNWRGSWPRAFGEFVERMLARNPVVRPTVSEIIFECKNWEQRKLRQAG